MEDHARLRPHASDQLGGGQSVHPRHLDVEKRDVGLTGDRLPRSLLAVPGLAHDLDLRMQAQQRAQEHTRPLMIVGDDEPSASFRAAFLHFGPPDIPSTRIVRRDCSQSQLASETKLPATAV